MKIDQRATLIRTKTSGVDPFVDAVLSTEATPEKALYESAVELKKSEVSRPYVEACLLSSNDLEEISKLLEIPVDVLEVYRKVYFNVEKLGKLQRLEVVAKAKPNDQVFLTWALSQGLTFIAWRLGKGTTVSPIEGLQDLFTTCLYKSKEAMFTPNADEASKEATKWTKLSMDLARLLKVWVMDSGAATAELKVALASLDKEFAGFAELNKDGGKDGESEEDRPTLQTDTSINLDAGFANLNDSPAIEPNLSLDDIK